MTQSHSLSYTIKFYIPLLDICLLLQSQLGHECHYNRSYITNTRSAESKTGGIQNYLFIYLLNQLILSSLLFHILPSILFGGGGLCWVFDAAWAFLQLQRARAATL